MHTMNAATGAAHEHCTVMVFRTLGEDSLLRRIRGEFREMPGMRLTLPQAMRLWTLDQPTCSRLFDALLRSRFLDVDANGRYRKAHGGN